MPDAPVFNLSAEMNVNADDLPIDDPELKDEPPGEGQKCKGQVDPTLDAIDKALQKTTDKMEKFGEAMGKHMMDGQEFLKVVEKATALNAKAMEEMWTKDPYGGAKQAALPVALFGGSQAWNALRAGAAANATRAGTVPGTGGGNTSPPPTAQVPGGNTGPPPMSGGPKAPPNTPPGELGSGPPPLTGGNPATGAMNSAAQELDMSCGPAAMGMVYEKMFGRAMPESVARALSQKFPGGFNPNSGTFTQNLRDSMRALGLNAHSGAGLTTNDVASAVAGGKPTIALIKLPNGANHFVVVDKTATVGNTNGFMIRDPGMPTNGPQFWSANHFGRMFTGHAVGIF